MTLVREGSSEGRRPRVRGRRFGDRRYHRRSLGWLTATAEAAAVATAVWWWLSAEGWVPGASEGRSMRTCAGNCTGIDPRTLGGSAASVFFSLSLLLSHLPCIPSLPPSVLTLISLLSSLASSAWFSLLPSLSPCSFTRISLFREMLALPTDERLLI